MSGTGQKSIERCAVFGDLPSELDEILCVNFNFRNAKNDLFYCHASRFILPKFKVGLEIVFRNFLVQTGCLCLIYQGQWSAIITCRQFR